MRPGYAYKFDRIGDCLTAIVAPDDDWEIEVYTPQGTERLVSSRILDGANCNVWLCPDGYFRAQLA